MKNSNKSIEAAKKVSWNDWCTAASDLITDRVPPNSDEKTLKLLKPFMKENLAKAKSAPRRGGNWLASTSRNKILYPRPSRKDLGLDD